MMTGTPISTILQHRRGFVRKLAGMLSLLMIGSACSGPASTNATRETQRRNLEIDFDATLSRCYLIAPATRALVGHAVGVLVFPTVGLINPVTGEWAGMGVLRQGSVFGDDYFLSIPKYDTAQHTTTRSIIFLFNSLSALDHFRVSNPWRASETLRARVPSADTMTMVLQGNVLLTNPSMPEMIVQRLDI
jgi:hypothetical protein